MRHRKERRGVSEIIGVLLMLAIVVSLGVLIFAFSSGSMNSLSQNYANAMTNRKSATAEKFEVQQVTFATGSSGTLAVDGSATGCFGHATQSTPCTSTSTSSGSTGTLTTLKFPDVIVVMVNDENAAGGGGSPAGAVDTVASVTSTPALTFSPRSSNTLGSPTFQDLEVWYAIASSTFSGTDHRDAEWRHRRRRDGGLWCLRCQHGLPVGPEPFASSDRERSHWIRSLGSGVSTSNANDMILGFQANGDSTAVGATSETAGTGFALVCVTCNVSNNGASNDADGAAEDGVVGTTEYNAAVPFGATIALADSWLVTADAIQASPAPISGADVYVRNVGTIPTTLASVYITDLTSNTFVAQFPLTTAQGTLNVGTVLDIPHAVLAFTASHDHVYSFTVASSLGNSEVYEAEAE